MDENTRQRLLTIAQIVIVVAAIAATAWYYFSQYDRITQANIEAFIRGFGAWAPVAYGALYVIAAPVPFMAPLISAVGGVLFGTWRGTVYVILIATLSSLVPFFLARRLGREWVASQLEDRKLNEIYEQSAGEKGFMFILLMRLIPVLPWEVQNYVAGLTQVAIPTFMLATMIGIIPGSFSLVFLGASATDPTSWQFFVAVGLKIVTALIPAVAIFIRRRRNKKAPPERGAEDEERDEDEVTD
jgi:uncharacterized membrane protein YdjX (TVP38/TMEM64 family)